MKRSKFRWYNSIRIKIPAVIVLIIMIPVLIFWQFNYNNMINNVRSNTEVIVQSGLSNLSLNIEFMLNKITTFATEQVNDDQFVKLLEDYIGARPEERQKARSQLTLYLSQSVLESKMVDSAFIMVEDGENIVTTVYGAKELSVHSPDGAKIYSEYKKDKINTIAWFSAANPLNGNEPTLSYIRPVRLHNTAFPSVSLICNMDSGDLNKMIKSITLTDSYVLVSDYNRKVMLSSDNALMRNDINSDPTFELLKKNTDSSAFLTNIKDRQYLVVSKTSLQTSWNYKEIVPMDVLYGNLQSQMYMIYIIAVISILVSILGALIVTRYVTRPIKELVGGLKRMEEGDLTTLHNIKRNDELGMTIRGFNTMVQKLRSLIDELYVKELLRKEAQVRSYQSQINEHFLYNVLNSICCIAKKENATDSADMIGILSKFFRLSLAKGHEFITVRDVEELIKYYMWIQKVRYGERFSYEIHTEPAILDCYVLKYLFQPIVENAVLHGIESRQGEGIIHISFKQEDGLLAFNVRDNGVGLTAEKIEELYRVFGQHTKIEGDNFALKNINAQIKIIYGEEYGLCINSIPLQETEVSFKIPLKESGVQMDG